MTFDDNEVLDVEAVVVFALTGPLTPVVFVVVAFVVEVEPLTTVTGPLTPEVPVVSAAEEIPDVMIEKIVRTANNRSFVPREITPSES